MNLTNKAATIYDRALDSGHKFSVAELADDLTAALLDDEHDLTELVSLAALQAVKQVDKQRTASDAQSSLFDLLDQAVPVGEGMRLARRDMRLDDWTAHLTHVAENVGRVNASAAKENGRFTALSSFLAAGLSTGDAIKAWQDAHPGELLP